MRILVNPLESSKCWWSLNSQCERPFILRFKTKTVNFVGDFITFKVQTQLTQSCSILRVKFPSTTYLWGRIRVIWFKNHWWRNLN